MKKLLIPVLLAMLGLLGCSSAGQKNSKEMVLRIANMEEYMDMGSWEKPIRLADGTEIISRKSMVERFQKWYRKRYDRPIRVEYSAVGTNEELYNLMRLGNTFDLVCTSEYMIMKLMDEGRLVPFSSEFRDVSRKDNYYIKGVSPFISDTLDRLLVGQDSVGKYSAGFMWGTMGLVYDPARVNKKDILHWSVLCDPDYHKQVTMKDSIRDSSFVGLCIQNEGRYLSPEFLQDPDYALRLSRYQNDTSPKSVDALRKTLTRMRANAFSMETDSAKIDLVAGRVVASMQWSGDGTYIIDCAEEEGLTLAYAVPQECTNLWFDGWVMPKTGIREAPDKQQAAEAFVNFISRPDNVVRNMDYIGYTSVVSGGNDETVFHYLKKVYEAKDEKKEDVVFYDLTYFFGWDKASVKVPVSQCSRQLYARYPTSDVIERSVVMQEFDEDARKRMSQMWIDVRCFDAASLFR